MPIVTTARRLDNSSRGSRDASRSGPTRALVTRPHRPLRQLFGRPATGEPAGAEHEQHEVGEPAVRRRPRQLPQASAAPARSTIADANPRAGAKKSDDQSASAASVARTVAKADRRQAVEQSVLEVDVEGTLARMHRR